MEDLALAFRGRSVFLTGHTGFKGSWLAIWLHELGARVTGFALPAPSSPSNFESSGVAGLIDKHVEGNVCDAGALRREIEAAAPDFVVHMAAQPLVRLSFEEPADTFQTNVMGTVHVLEAVRQLKRPTTVLVVTSDKCYENTDQIWPYRESDPMGGHDPYSASKGAAEIVVSSYRRSFFPPARLADHGVRLASVRAGNVIGGGDWAKDRIVPDLARSIAAGKPTVLRNPRFTRPWQHVLDALHGYLQLGARIAHADGATFCDGWNFGPDEMEEWTVERLAEEFIRAWGAGECRSNATPEGAHEARTLRLDVTKARLRLGWRPRWTTAEAIRRTADWYQRYYSGSTSTLEACRSDIRAFQASP